MNVQEWLEVIRAEYLRDFIPAGGAAVKFVVPGGAEDRRAVMEQLRTAAEEEGFQFVFLDAEQTKLHLIDQLFHEVARQVDWAALARGALVRLLPDLGYRAPTAADLTLAALAAANGYDEPYLLSEIKRGVWNRLYHDYAMTREFRLAMIRLCQAVLDPGDEPTLRDAVLQWLRGELRLISALKRALIFQKIARHNARHMLFSLAHFLKLAGKPGLVLCLDIARYAQATRPSERVSGLYYSSAATLDAYEVLRQLIDATDELAYGFVAVLAGPEFLADDRRGLRSYHALYLRIADEVRDRYRANPRSALVRLAAGRDAAGRQGEPQPFERPESEQRVA